MPQIDISTFLSQAFWLLVCFCLLWGMMSVFVTPKLTDIIEQRKRKINEFIQKAESLRLQAEQSLQAYNTAISSATSKAEKEINENKIQLDTYLAETENELTEKLNKKLAEHEINLEKERRSVSQQIDAIAQNLAFDIVNKLGFSAISQQDIKEIAHEEKLHG